MLAKRLGVEMSLLKARIVDLIETGGGDGVPCDTVFAAIFSSRRGSRETMKAHVWQINERIGDEGWRIVYDRSGTPTYRLVRLPDRRRIA